MDADTSFRPQPIPKAHILDPRERIEAIGSPISDAANLPLSELRQRVHELPPPGQPLLVADVGSVAQAAVEGLSRTAEIVPATYADHPYRPARLWDPHPLVERAVQKAAPGVALDLGCGTGRDAIYLASAGWHVIAVDHLADALDRGRLTASRLLGVEETRIDWRCARAGEVELSGEIDLLISILFFDRDATVRASERLRPAGRIVLETFTPTHRKATGKPKDAALALDLLQAAELFPGFVMEVADEDLRNGRHTLRLSAVCAR